MVRTHANSFLDANQTSTFSFFLDKSRNSKRRCLNVLFNVPRAPLTVTVLLLT